MPIRQPACICGELLVNHPGGIACGECTNEDRFNCKYCSKAGVTCDGAPGDTSGAPPTQPRVCVREEYQEIETPPYYIDNGVAIELPGPMQLLKVWTFHYSDGTTEQLSQTGAL